MDALRKSLQETRARLGATVDANNARQAAMLKLPFAGEEALREAGGFSFHCSASQYQVRSPKLTVVFSQSSYIAMTYRVVGTSW